MLKSTYLIQLGLLGALTVPVLDKPGASLEQALAETERALAELLGREGQKEVRYDSAIARALGCSEPALPDPRRRDELLESLRRDVGQLQEELDELEVHGLQGAPRRAAAPGGASGDGPPRPEPPAPAPLRTGLDDELRELLGASAPPIASGGLPVALRPAARTALEEPGYSADPVRQGRALFRAARYAEGLALLERLGSTPEADYWRARCLERLRRPEEALRLYERIVEREPESDLGRRAAHDRDFVEWQVSFERRLAERRQP